MVSTYAVRDGNLLLSHGERKYIFKVRDLPPEEKPRELLTQYGPAALSTPQLMAVILGVGTKKEELLQMSSRIVRDYGTKGIVAEKNVARLAADLDIPEGKALQIVAAVELGRRLFERNESGAAIIRTAKDVFDYAKDIRELPKEHLRGIYLNTHYKVIHDETISIGTLDANIIHPREVFKPALEYSAAAVVLVHNHPSKVAEPSSEDVAVTKQLIDAGRMLGVPLIDHIVVTKDEFRSVPGEY
jgi:DNA repair protein RadC